MPEDKTVILFYDENIPKKVSEWCKLHKWRAIKYREFRGCEGTVTILYCVNDFHPEYYSRATNGLIIVHK